MEYLQVTTTLPTRDEAERIARHAVTGRLAACAQVSGPLRSVYRWRGAVEEAEEWLCTLKTTRLAWPALEAAIVAAHPYENPELVAVTIDAGAPAYLEWIAAAVAPPA